VYLTGFIQYATGSSWISNTLINLRVS